MMTYVITKYGDRELQGVAEIAGHWLSEFFELKDVKKVVIDIDPDLDCWGECGERDVAGVILIDTHQFPTETEDATYEISVNPKQCLRDFIATIVHEFVHIKQWETGEWDGDGEAEANHLQYTITDRMWKEGVF